MRKYNISANLVRTIEQLYDKATSAVQMNGSKGEWSRTTVGVWQGCLLWETISKSGQEWALPAQLGQLKTGQDGKGLLRIHLWCPDDLPRLWDRLERIDFPRFQIIA